MQTVAELEARLIELAKEMAGIEWQLKWAREAERQQDPGIWNRVYRSPSTTDPAPWLQHPLSGGPRDVVSDPLAPRC